MRFTAADLAGPVLCGIGALCMLAALAVDLDSTAAKALMAAAAIAFVPGAFSRSPSCAATWARLAEAARGDRSALPAAAKRTPLGRPPRRFVRR